MVTQAIAPDYISAAATRVDAPGARLTLVRMEIGGLRFVVPLADVAAVIEPTAMERQDDDAGGVWIGRIASRQGVIAVASGPRLLRVGSGDERPGRLAILRARQPVGLAVDRVLGARTVDRDQILSLPETVAALRAVPVSGAIWSEDDELEVLLDVDALLSELESDPNGNRQPERFIHSYRQKIVGRYGGVDYRRALEVRFEGSAERWLLPMSTVRLVTDAPEPHPLPRSPERIAGLLSWRRGPIPVIDPTYQLRIPRPVGQAARLVVIGEPAAIGAPSQEADAALLVSAVAGIQYNLHVEHGLARGRDGEELRVIRIMDILS